jgi:quinol monooxygenase YgiN
MIKHIVMWKLKGEGPERQDNIQTVKAALETCRDIVPGMLKFEIGIDARIHHTPWDLCIYSEFSGREAMAAYQQHPVHQATMPVIGPLIEARGVVDYEG